MVVVNDEPLLLLFVAVIKDEVDEVDDDGGLGISGTERFERNEY